MEKEYFQKLRFLLPTPFLVKLALYISNVCVVTNLFTQSLISNPSQSIFSNGWSEVSIVAVGDIMLGSWVTPLLNQKGAFYPFEKTASYFKSSDIAIANLEAPFTQDGEPFDKKFTFKVPPEHAHGLREAGIEVVTLANNHIMDYGETGLISTMQTLDKVEVKYCGAGLNLERASRPVVVEINDRRIAFFGYSMTFPQEFYAKEGSSGTAYPEPELMSKSLKAWEDSVDFTVVSFHWSAEKRDIPKDYQVYFAHLAIDNGADLVLGHHPHVLQGIERYKNRLIAYSLGNFAFGSYSSHAVDSIILKAYLNDDGLIFAYCIPINVDNREVEFQPTILNGTCKTEVINKLQRLSLSLNDGQDIIEDSGIIFGEWGTFYNDWLLETVLLSYWNSFFEKDFFSQIMDQSDSSMMNFTQ